ncbi:MAG: hypothetical protein EAZ91_18950 [Cytophagales bacterium]|nr:MAG: hypothetical protein EAZ91_18950 [Cytophagales bacterium]
MSPSTPANPERIWVIQQYLNGTLPEVLHQQVEERRKSDPDFDQQVVTLGLLDVYAETERNTLSFYEETDKIIIASAHERRDYDTRKRLTFLPELIKLHPQLFIGLAALLILVFTWVVIESSPTVAPTAQVMIDDSELSVNAIGSTVEKVSIVRYERVPGFWGLFQESDQYKWPGDTLFLYGKTLPKVPLDSLQVFATDYAKRYYLQLGQQRFLIQKGQSETIPLIPDPNETP